MDRERNLQVTLLLSAVSSLKVSSNALQSYLRNHCLHILKYNGFKVPISAKKILCQFCHTPWEHGAFTIKVLPSVRKGKRIRKIIRRMESQTKLSEIHTKIMSSIQTANTIVLKCWICHKLTTFKTTKSISSRKIIPIKNECSNVKKKNKAKKHKNKFSGLKEKVLNQFHALREKTKEVQTKRKFKNLEHCNSVNATKRKMALGLVSDNPTSSTGKMNRFEKAKDIQEKQLQNPLNISNCQEVTKLSSDDFIPAEVNVKQKGKNIAKAKKDSKFLKTNPNEKNKSNMNKKNKVINPFCEKVQLLLSKKSGKKLNQLKDLIKSEEKKIVSGSSLKDFLTLL